MFGDVGIFMSLVERSLKTNIRAAVRKHGGTAVISKGIYK